MTLLSTEATQGLSHRLPRTGEQLAAQRDGVILQGQGGVEAWHSWTPPGQGLLPCPPCSWLCRKGLQREAQGNCFVGMSSVSACHPALAFVFCNLQACPSSAYIQILGNPASHVAYPRGVAEKSLDTREDLNQRNEVSPILSGIRLAGRMGRAASPPSKLDIRWTSLPTYIPPWKSLWEGLGATFVRREGGLTSPWCQAWVPEGWSGSFHF